jgi:acyl-CoA synthetase (AMP-forming)/AMP-acid ligase II
MNAALISSISRAQAVSLHRPNVVDLIVDHARRSPDTPALVTPGGDRDRVIRYGDLVGRAAAYAAWLDSAGIPAGARVQLLVRPDAEVYALVLAILARGMTLVVADGRGGVRRLLATLADAAPDVVIATPAVMCWWPLVSTLRRARRFTMGGSIPGAGHLADLVAQGTVLPLAPRAVPVETPAVVSFSSGNTGRSKAVVRTHGVLLAQHRALAAAIPLDDADVNLPGFPLATLHNLCCGTTTILAPADLRTMADAEPAAVAAIVDRCGVTSLSGSPAYIGNLARHLIRAATPARSVATLVVGGGPVGRALCAEIRRAFPLADVHVVYGATEAEPITAVTIDEVAAEREREGFLVGRPVEGSEVCLLATTDSRASVGEVAVRGEHVAGGSAWHRTGDIGRFDANGRLWLLGRVGTAVSYHGITVHPYVVEADALSVAGVRAAAFVAHSRAPNGELVLQLDIGADDGVVLRDLRDVLADRGLPELSMHVTDAIPMDARHGSKVARPALLTMLERENR